MYECREGNFRKLLDPPQNVIYIHRMDILRCCVGRQEQMHERLSTLSRQVTIIEKFSFYPFLLFHIQIDSPEKKKQLPETHVSIIQQLNIPLKSVRWIKISGYF